MTQLILEELQELRSNNLYRKVRALERFDSVRASLDGKNLLLFCGNDYLGLSFHPRVVTAAKKAMDLYGVGAGAARLISGTSGLHSLLEEKLARMKNKKRALVWTAGYLANLGILTAFAGGNDAIILDKLCHASIVDGARLSGATIRVFPHKNYERCAEILSKCQDYRRRVLVTDAVFSMDGDTADLRELVRLKETYDGFLVIDDAHGTGVMGPTGKGLAEGTGLEGKIDVMMGTLSKAFGCLGGFVCADEEQIEYLVNFARSFIYATALPPALCAAALEAIQVMEEEPDIRIQLWKNVEQFRNGLKHLGYLEEGTVTPIFPLMLGDEKRAMEASQKLLQKGFLIPAIRPPTVPKGKARLRLTLSAAHREEDIEKLLNVLKEILEK